MVISHSNFHICNRCCLSVFLSVSNFGKKLPNAFAWKFHSWLVGWNLTSLFSTNTAAAHGRFSHIHQMVPIWPHPIHDWFPGRTWLSIPNCISNGTRFAQLTAERPYTLQLAAISPLKIAPSHGGSGPRLIHGSISQAASRPVQPHLHSSRS